MSHMELNESVERFRESLKRAASRAREIGIRQKQPLWGTIAIRLETLMDAGIKITRAKSVNQQQQNKDLDSYIQKMTGEKNG